MNENLGSTPVSSETARQIEPIYREWDRAWSSDDLEVMVALDAPDAVPDAYYKDH